MTDGLFLTMVVVDRFGRVDTSPTESGPKRAADPSAFILLHYEVLTSVSVGGISTIARDAVLGSRCTPKRTCKLREVGWRC